ncbi:RNA ligase [Lampropedia hyalina DSM 16112]|jgi:ATP-dependent RNA circularization protein (DNA/RNA ligase family)|uniref:RNA ligase n=1 Tax=Lampropedia hyalina DSM 16112 TaxID=1122156 RepID=A0A1M5CYJ2_9BURK|nr:RNA ligase family protein [Lampropedia hyalina]SHF59707.1 RNA ligase [Lampropedia hyalina DSM 16112]
MTDFFRFPSTPHLVWLGTGKPRDDKILSPDEATALLTADVVVEEKVDGANLGFSLTPDAHLQVQNRGQYLHEPYSGQFARLPQWLELHGAALAAALTPNIILFGEWCAARHSLDYDRLPDWLLAFDVYDRTAKQFWSTTRRNRLATQAGLVTVPQITRGHTTVPQLQQLIASTSSHFRKGPLEGVVLRRESAHWCDARAKLVRPDFTQTIDTHWRNRIIQWNRLDYPPSP